MKSVGHTASRTDASRGALASFRFYEELNDFLPQERRKREFEYRCARAATVKNAVEALGVPHTEVELILANGEPVDFSYLVREGDRISVYPKFEAFDIAPLVRLRERPLRELRFVADAHLGGLARFLRMLGFDTLFRNDIADAEILALSSGERRVVLTRDRELLKCRSITHGCYVHALVPREQLREVVERLQLASSARPFSLCLHCNLPLAGVGKEAVVHRLPPNVAATYRRFHWCRGCDRVYWEGSHWQRMREMLDGVL
ncbi:MAG: twitching motility protein PilT [Betaproteobacteria bacterium RIFCSPLOWO2_02_FULL_62_17]|nr:MAG: twitching motility protein PilT [Betaproteobacteria bacterium RIFCSPLOWO2_02_FULL_62_17]